MNFILKWLCKVDSNTTLRGTKAFKTHIRTDGVRPILGGALLRSVIDVAHGAWFLHSQLVDSAFASRHELIAMNCHAANAKVAVDRIACLSSSGFKDFEAMCRELHTGDSVFFGTKIGGGHFNFNNTILRDCTVGGQNVWMENVRATGVHFEGDAYRLDETSFVQHEGVAAYITKKNGVKGYTVHNPAGIDIPQSVMNYIHLWNLPPI